MSKSKAFLNGTDTMAESESTPVYDIKKTCLRPIFIAMTLCGCHCPRYDKSFTCKVLRVYKVFVCSCSVLYLMKCIAAFWIIDKSYYSAQLLQTIWGVAAALNFFICLKSTSERMGHQHKAMEHWSQILMPKMDRMGVGYCRQNFRKRQIILLTNERMGHQHKAMEHWSQILMPKMDRMGVGYCRQNFRKRQIILLTIAAMLIILVIATHIALIPRGTFLAVFDEDFLTAPLKPSILTHTVITILAIVVMLVFTIPVFFMIIIAKILSIHFKDFHNHLQSEIHKSDCKMPDTFQDLRILHNQLCGLVSDLDKDMRYLYGNVFVWNIAIALLCLYLLVKGGIDFVSMTFYIYFFVLSIATLALMSIFAAIVNKEAHAPLDTIYFINVSEVSLEKSTQINLFLSKLTGTQVGFSTCGLLVITKEFILTIAGVFLTYFAVLYTL